MLVFDIFLIAIPAVLIIKIILCLIAYGIDKWKRNISIETVSPLSVFLVKFNEQLGTAFTIAFITIISTMVRRWALYKAQKGAHLAELEQLQASISLPSTVKMIWSLRRFGSLSGGLLALWSFYYLGSQACAREYAQVNSKPFHKMNLALPASTALVDIESSGLNFTDGTNRYEDMSQAFIAAYVLQSSKEFALPYDIRGNPRVPLIETLTGQKAIETDKLLGRGEWLKVDQPNFQIFAAYSGPDLWQYYGPNEFNKSTINDDHAYDNYKQFLGQLDFTSQYTYVNCSIPVGHPLSAFPTGTSADSYLSINVTKNDRAYENGVPTLPQQFELWGRWNFTNITGDYDSTYILNGSMVTTCDLTSSFVDVKANCQPQGCTAKKIRRSEDHPVRSLVTPFDNTTLAQTFFDQMLTSMGPLSVPIDDKGHVYNTGVARLISFDSLLADYWRPSIFGNLSEDDLQLTVNGLISAINTYYMSASSTDCSYPEDTNPSGDCVLWTGEGAVYNPQYMISVPWIIIDFFSCFILLVAASFGYWLRMRTIAPDIFGYISSLTRENPHFALATEKGSALSGLERARLLGNVKIKIGEYTHEDGLPRVVVSHVTEGVDVGTLKKEGRYA